MEHGKEGATNQDICVPNIKMNFFNVRCWSMCQSRTIIGFEFELRRCIQFLLMKSGCSEMYMFTTVLKNAARARSESYVFADTIPISVLHSWELGRDTFKKTEPGGTGAGTGLFI